MFFCNSATWKPSCRRHNIINSLFNVTGRRHLSILMNFKVIEKITTHLLVTTTFLLKSDSERSSNATVSNISLILIATVPGTWATAPQPRKMI